MPKTSKSVHQRTDKDWEAIWDAQTLASAQIIKSDEARIKAARAWAAQLAKEENEQKEALQSVADGKD